MKIFKLKKQFRGYKKGTQFYLIAESEFIGVKSFVLRTLELTQKLEIGENELVKNFIEIK